MIVRNESAVILRCLASVKDFVTYWVIVDTGSEDGTQMLIKEAMQGISGELHERCWVDFEHNRNEALALAKGKGEYLLFIDADEHLVFSETFQEFPLELDAYLIDIHQENQTSYQRIALVKSSLDWNWEGVLHEEIKSKIAKTYGRLKGVVNRSVSSEGYRAKDPKKYKKDIELLRRALEKDPCNCRYSSFLALSCEAAGEYKAALEAYENRVMLGGEDLEEIFYALYRIARLQERLNMDSELFVKNYCEAYQMRPERAEPLFHLAAYYARKQNYALGYVLAQFASLIPKPSDRIYVEDWVYQTGLPNCLAECKANTVMNPGLKAWDCDGLDRVSNSALRAGSPH